MSAVEVLAAIAIVVLVIGRQLRGEPLRGRRVVLLPIVLVVVGFMRVREHHPSPTTADVACLTVAAVLASGVGVAQGTTMRLEHHDGGLWGQLPVRGLWLWAALIVSRVFVTVVAGAVGAHVAASTASILLLLGVNRLGQAAVITIRALSSGIPFAPERNGRVFLSGRSEGRRASGRHLQP